MIKIRFTAAAVYQTVPPVRYAPDEVHEMRDDIARRWLSRGVAVEHVDEPEPVSQAVEIPSGWRALLAAEKIDLATRLGAEDISTGTAAADFIEAEVAKRDAAK